MGHWVGNARRGRAFKVLRERRDQVRLRDCHGTEFTVSAEKLDRFGYRHLKSKPAYADRGGY